MDISPTSRWLSFMETGGDSAALLWKFEKALNLESSFPTCLRMPSVSKSPEEITLAMRNGCTQVLRCLKVWYDLPSEVLFLATAHLDHFLSRMKVRPKHLSVIALSCFHLSSRQVACEEHSEFLLRGHQSGSPINIPDPRDLLIISQCRCSLGDLSRMEAIVAEKLSLSSSQGKMTDIMSSNGGCATKQEWPPKSYSPSEDIVPNGKSFTSTRVLPQEYSLQSSVQQFSVMGRSHSSILQTSSFPHHSHLPYPITPMSFLDLMHSFLLTSMRSQTSESGKRLSTGEVNDCLNQTSPARLQHHLEAIACDGSLSCFRPSEIALSLMCVMLDRLRGSVTCISSPSPRYKMGRQAQSSGLLSSMMEMKKLCKITDAGFTRCHSAVLRVVRYYESQCDATRWYGDEGSHCPDDYEDEMSLDEEDEDERGWKRNGRRRNNRGAYVEGWGPLSWRVSQRTLRNLRPTEKLVSWPPMPTIHETNLSYRIRSCSLSSEESSDPGEEEEECEEDPRGGGRGPNNERGNEWRPMLTPQKAWASMNPLLEEEGGEE
ncbi:uncharacterized protein CycG [Hetaerina americana]|uniref:uncharacterized protein CycG n=1 Tax=Hetaerina americana TaxID=62018 RepID=UPI003A7F2DA7